MKPARQALWAGLLVLLTGSLLATPPAFGQPRGHAERGPTYDTVFQTLEGGIGSRAGNRFHDGPPKFSMNGTNARYSTEVGSPGWSIFRDSGPLADDRLGIHRMHLKRLVDRGLLVQRCRGLYEASEPRMTQHGSIIEVVTRVPNATLCLLTALRLHRLTTQNRFEIWIMIDRKARRPSIDAPSVRVVRASGPCLAEGVELMHVDGIDVRITTVAKTVADCFRYRNTVGNDVAIEALKDAWRRKAASVDELVAAATIDRVATVMRPYLESLA